MFRFSILLCTVFTLYLLPKANACEFSDVSFSADFVSGGLDSCHLNDSGEYVLTFLPEDKPINPSPWFYFSVTAKQPQSVAIVLRFDGFSPRYLPKFSRDKKHWSYLPFDTKGDGMTITLEATSTPLYIAAQKPILNDDYTSWMEKAAKQFAIQPVTLGQSIEGRDIAGFTLSKESNKEWVIFVGRQHPPEVTGAVAMFAFLEEFLTTTQNASAFLSRFNVLVVPNINPDGVYHGHWRHNLGHKDLNRDWNVFAQPETRAVKAYLDKITDAGGKIVMGMDFHSTHNNVFYTIPQTESIAPTTMVVSWLDNLQQKTKGVFKVLDKPGTSPGKGVFKQFMADVYNVHGVTYEVGDNEPDVKTRYVARHAAKTLIDVLLDTKAEDFVLNTCPAESC